MIVDQTHGLHEGITNRRTDKLETAPEQILAEGVGFGGAGGELYK